MPRIRCRYMDCIFLDEGYCSAAAVEIDPDTGCATYAPNEEAAADNEWDEDEEMEEWEDADAEDDDEDSWLDEDDDEI